MKTTPSRRGPSRRDLFKLLAAGGVAAVGSYALFAYPPWLNYDQSASQIRTPVAQSANISAEMRELVRYATLAASGHNTQPWTFTIAENAIDIHLDYARHLPALDPSDRELWVSLGAALLTGLRWWKAVGFRAMVTPRDLWNAGIIAPVVFGLLHALNVLGGSDPIATLLQMGEVAQFRMVR